MSSRVSLCTLALPTVSWYWPMSLQTTGESFVSIFYWLMLNIQGLDLNDYTFKKIFLSLVFCKSNFITSLYVLCYCNEAKQKNHQSSEAITKVRERWYQRSNSLVPKSHFIMCLSLLENKVGLSPEDLAWLLQHLLSCWKSQNPPAGKWITDECFLHLTVTFLWKIGLWILTDDVLPFLLVTLSRDPS